MPEIPANPATGRIEDVLGAILRRDWPQPLRRVLAQVPAGWSRAAAISALQDGVMDGWVGTEEGRFFLASDPPPPRVCPLHLKWKRERLIDVCLLLHSQLTVTQHDLREIDAPAPLRMAVVELRRATAETLSEARSA